MVEQFLFSKTQIIEHLTTGYMISFYKLMVREAPCMLKTVCVVNIVLGGTHKKSLGLISEKNLKFE